MNDAIAASGAPDAERLLAIVQQLVGETPPRHSYVITLHTSFERDLGLDSLARVELMRRVEKTFGVELPDEALSQTDTPLELLRFLGKAPQTLATEALPGLFDTQAIGLPGEAPTLMDVLEWHTARRPEILAPNRTAATNHLWISAGSPPDKSMSSCLA